MTPINLTFKNIYIYIYHLLSPNSSNTKLTQEKDDVRIRRIRVRGGNVKFRALRLNEGNFAWASEGIARKTKIVDVVYNASNNELVRTKTLVKNAIV